MSSKIRRGRDRDRDRDREDRKRIESKVTKSTEGFNIILCFSCNTRRLQDQVDNREVREVGTEQFGVSRQKISSRFSAALEQPLLSQTSTEKMRTPR